MLNKNYITKSKASQLAINIGPRLSVNELRCLCLSFQGNTSQQIANILNISVFTVNSYKRRIMSKFECRTMSNAIYKAIELGLLKNMISK
jgi:DNA-binding CsgD family transcriptional regulator